MDENAVEQALLVTLSNLGWRIAHGPDLESYDNGPAERDYSDTFLPGRLVRAINRLNSGIEANVVSDAIRKLTRNNHSELIDNNYDFHRLLVNGIPMQYRLSDGSIKSDLLRVVDLTTRPTMNFWPLIR